MHRRWWMQGLEARWPKRGRAITRLDKLGSARAHWHPHYPTLQVLPDHAHISPFARHADNRCASTTSVGDGETTPRSLANTKAFPSAETALSRMSGTSAQSRAARPGGPGGSVGVANEMAEMSAGTHTYPTSPASLARNSSAASRRLALGTQLARTPHRNTNTGERGEKT
jgi:hypothetical protein